MTGPFVLSWSVGVFFLEAPGVTGHELVESPVHRRRKVLSSNIQDFLWGQPGFAWIAWALSALLHLNLISTLPGGAEAGWSFGCFP